MLLLGDGGVARVCMGFHSSALRPGGLGAAASRSRKCWKELQGTFWALSHKKRKSFREERAVSGRAVREARKPRILVRVGQPAFTVFEKNSTSFTLQRHG